MSFLAPIFAFGAIALAAPLIVHLIRSIPQRRQVFSSVMFLDPAKPKLTQARRVDDWWLLALRLLAIAMLVLAFMRPFQASELTPTAGPPISRITIVLVDTSASMRTPGLWPTAQSRFQSILDGLESDEVFCVGLFDREVRFVSSLNDWSRSEFASLQQQALNRIADAEPSWFATQLDDALTESANRLETFSLENGFESTPKRIVVISDFQSGARLDGLSSYQWPNSIQLQLERAVTTTASNIRAWPMLAPSVREGDSAFTQRGSIPIRIASFGESVQDITLAWQPDKKTSDDASGGDASGGGASGGDGDSGGDLNSAIAPLRMSAGGVQILTIPDVPSAENLTVSGDSISFDNTSYIARGDSTSVRILVIDSETEDKTNVAPSNYSLSFFLEKVPFSTEQITVRLDRRDDLTTEFIADLGLTKENPSERVRLAFFSGQTIPSDDSVQALLRAGVSVVLVLDDCGEASRQSELEGLLGSLLGNQVRISPPKSDDAFDLLTNIDFESPLFRAFQTPQFNDFTTLRFWKPVQMNWQMSEPDNADSTQTPSPDENETRVVATYDRGGIALVQRKFPAAVLSVFTCGWRTDQSNFALSSKFVPMLLNLLEQSRPAKDWNRQMLVGESIRADIGQSLVIRSPNGNQTQLDAGDEMILAEPGIFQIDGDGEQVRVAANIPFEESDVTILDFASFESMGIPLDPIAKESFDEPQRREIADSESENRQKWWRWLLLASLGLIGLECWYSRS